MAASSSREDEEDEEEEEEEESELLSLQPPILRHLSCQVLGYRTLPASSSSSPTTNSEVTYYYVQVSVESGQFRTFFIEKRFSCFYQLSQELSLTAAPPAVLQLPPLKRTWLRHVDRAFLDDRARQLAAFLRCVVGTPALVSTRAAQRFFFSDVCSEHQLEGMSSSAVDSVCTPLLMTPGMDGRWRLLGGGNSAGLTPPPPLSSLDLEREFASAGIPFEDGDRLPPRRNSRTTNSNSKWWDVWGACTSGDGEASASPLGRPREYSVSSAGGGGGVDDDDDASPPPPSAAPPPPPPLRIVFLLVGSRGDVQPYVALGKALQREHGHHVRIAAHECFREWIVQDHGLDFMPIAGDPKELLAMVVENKMFSYTFVKNGLTTHRAWVYQVLLDCWRACTVPVGQASNPPSSSLLRAASRPVAAAGAGDAAPPSLGPGVGFSRLSSHDFRADVVIANPPSFAGWHIAEALGVPLISTFPMPWTRTRSFPNPFTALGNGTSASVNWLSYGAVDRLIWMGMGDLVNKFRTEELLLDPIWTLSAKGHRYVYDYQVPCLYCWSPAVLAKPRDWGEHVLVNGYMFLDDSDGAAWEPGEELRRCFGDESKPVVFIGFGSIVVRHPEQLSRVVEQVARVLIAKHDCHVLVQKGWAGVELDLTISGLFQLTGSAPHAWLFARCAAVVHHGGAGTTSTALSLGVPSVIVPFFGDQFFWANTIQQRELGEAEPYGPGLTPQRLVECVEKCMFDQVVRRNCVQAAERIRHEDGVHRAVDFVHQVVRDTGVFARLELHHQDPVKARDWRIYPYFDLKQRVKEQRRDHAPGLRRGFKRKFKGFTSHQPSVAGAQGLELMTEEDVVVAVDGGGGGDGDDNAHADHHHHHHDTEHHADQQDAVSFAYPPHLLATPPTTAAATATAATASNSSTQ